MSTRRGDFFFTASGVQFWPLDPRPEEIRIEDIAHGLAHVCRWGGHSRSHFSVAQHSILVASHLPPGLKLQGLLHDATEAYLGDMIRPLKRNMEAFREAEYRLWMVIAEKWNLPLECDPAVKEADERALETERQDLCHQNAMLASNGLPRFPETIHSWYPQYASGMFLLTFRELTEGRAVA
jgi:5'-deoxynucleotidase YfbR-like HD superfamily hydrolase